MTDLRNRLPTVLSRMCSQRTMDRLVEPILTDIQVERGDAVRSGRVWRGRWVQVAGYVTLLRVLARRGIDEVLHWTPDDRHTLMRTIVFGAAITGITTLLLAVPILWNSPARKGVPYFEPFMFLIPQGLPLAIPIGLALGIVCGTAKRSRPGHSLNVILLLTIACTGIVLLDLFWILPEANQAYRVSMWGPHVLRGTNELTLGELRALLWGTGQFEPGIPLAAPHDWPTLAFAYYTRWALSCTTLVLAMFTLFMPGGRLLRGMAASAAVLGYYQLMYGGRQLVIHGTVPAYAAAWLPNATLLALAIVLMLCRFRQAAAPCDV
jgi:lipopolysaccharide export system permease LptF/LptG-like protein